VNAFNGRGSIGKRSHEDFGKIAFELAKELDKHLPSGRSVMVVVVVVMVVVVVVVVVMVVMVVIISQRCLNDDDDEEEDRVTCDVSSLRF